MIIEQGTMLQVNQGYIFEWVWCFVFVSQTSAQGPSKVLSVKMSLVSKRH